MKPMPPDPPALADLDLDLKLHKYSKLADLDLKLDKLADLKDLDFKLHKLPPELHDLDLKLDALAKVDHALGRGDFKMPVLMAPETIFHGRATDHERSYERGIRALDERQYERALEAFSPAAATTGTRTDGALFGKAYALHRLGRRDEALAALAQLRTSHAASRWMADAQALETEIKQGQGQKDRAQLDAEEDLKALALSGLMEADPEKAVPAAEQILRSSPSRKLKEHALRAIANSDSQRSRDLLAGIAQGKVGNPDLQLRAIRYLGSRRTDNRKLLREIYSSAADEQVRRAVLRALGSLDDKEQLLQIARSDKEPRIRTEAVSLLGNSASAAELWTLYQAETSLEVKQRIIQRLRDVAATERLLELAKTEKELSLRQQAIRALGSAGSGDALTQLHASETDPAVKRAIIDALYSQRNGKALVELARKEKDPQARREIVARLSRINSKEASDYLMDLLK